MEDCGSIRLDEKEEKSLESDGVHVPGGDDVAVGTCGVFDQNLADGDGCLYAYGPDFGHDVEYALFGDGGVRSDAHQGKVSVFNGNVAGNGPHGVGHFLFRPFGSLVAGVALDFNNL